MFVNGDRTTSRCIKIDASSIDSYLKPLSERE